MTTCSRTPHACLVDIKSIIREKTVAVDDSVRQHLRDTRSAVRRLAEYATEFERDLAALEDQDRLGNFEIQDLMSKYNEAEALACNLLKKRDDVANGLINKI
jgi:hypothetical protein